MMKRIIALGLSIMLLVSMASCGKKQDSPERAEVSFAYEEQDYSSLGVPVTVGIPESWGSYKDQITLIPIKSGAEIGLNILALPTTAFNRHAEIIGEEGLTHEEIQQKIDEEVALHIQSLGVIIVTDQGKERLDSLMREMDYKHGEVVQEKDGKTILYLWNQLEDLETDSWEPEDVEFVETAYEPLKELQQVIHFTEAGTSYGVNQGTGLEGLKNWTFTAEDLEGNTVTEDFFKENELTMVNVWGTFCGPCRAELADLGEVAREYEGKVGFLGIVSDVNEGMEGGTKDLAISMLKDSQVEYTNILLNSELVDSVTRHVVGVPTTFFVDKEGNVVGDVIVGAQTAENFRAAIDNLLED